LAQQQKYIKKLLKKIAKLEFTVYCIAKIITLYLNVVFITSKIAIEIDDEAEIILSKKKPCFITLWHGRILIIPKIMKRYGSFTVLTSTHNDGKYIDEFINFYGNKTIRGSTFKGGFPATKDIIKNLQDQNKVVITPDGPRGPKWKVNSAITNFAAKFDVPIICVSFSATKVKMLNTWDKFIIPLPFAKILVNISSPVYFKDKDDIRLEKTMLKQMRELDEKCGLQS
jgi:lysophospholipid acyltransferase (LPLAT)-like uncharacterized protein